MINLGLKDRPELTELLRQAIDAFDKLTPEQQRAHRAAQRKSWVIGELMLANPEMTREEAARLYDNAAQ